MGKCLPNLIELVTKRVHCVRVLDEPPGSSSMRNVANIAFLKNAVIYHSKPQYMA